MELSNQLKNGYKYDEIMCHELAASHNPLYTEEEFDKKFHLMCRGAEVMLKNIANDSKFGLDDEWAYKYYKSVREGNFGDRG